MLASQGSLNCRLCVLRDPTRKPMAHGLHLFDSLVATGQQFATVADHVLDLLAGVAGQVEVFGAAMIL